MPELSLAPVRNLTVTATRASRRLRLRRRRRSMIGEWWWRAKVALRLEAPPHRRLINPTIARATGAAAAGAGAGAVLLITRRLTRAKGKAKAAMHHVGSTDASPDDDRTLADKVRTEMFRRPDAPSGAVNVSVVDGVVYLRGEVADLDEVQHLVDDALAVFGVMGVESMLHTPGTPAPTNGAG